MSTDDAATPAQQFVRACGDEAAAAFFSKAIRDREWLTDWAARARSDLDEGYDTWDLETEAGLPTGKLKDVLNILRRNDSEYAAMRAALSIGPYLVGIDWKMGAEDALFNLDRLFEAHHLDAISDKERSAIEAGSMPELLAPMSALAATRGRVLVQVDDRSDSYLIALAVGAFPEGKLMDGVHADRS